MDRYLFPTVLMAALVGFALAWAFPSTPWLLESAALFKNLFLSVLKMIVAPLVFFSVLSGILRLDAAKQLRRIGTLTVVYYVVTTAFAIALGLTVVFVFHPWTSAPPLSAIETASTQATLIGASDNAFSDLLGNLLAQMFVNPFAALTNLNILGIVTNSIVLGLALLIVLPGDSTVKTSIHEITSAIYKLASWAVWMVPVGIVGIVYEMTTNANSTLIGQLAAFSGIVIATTLLHMVIVLPSIGWFAGRTHPFVLAKKTFRPVVVALSSSSSAATLPVSFQAANDLGVSSTTSSFVLPLGATINMDGTALFEGIAAIFLAYLFGLDLSAIATVTVFIVAMLASIGAPGIPSGSMAGMQMVLLAVGIPLEGILILLLVERPLDTIRTAANVLGDLVGCVVIDRHADLP
ncbi:MAG: dicarboxylate/amino acid:cation symporter [Pseudomonadales bacterium]|nr:dicarboxylate/amino acid:cation symporter [Pseudomonadales bacterium]